MNLKLQQITATTQGRILRHGAEEFRSYGIDSRKIQDGGLFFALKGETTDGHLYVEAARKNGATGAVVESAVETGQPFSLIQVPDSLKALHDLAASIRKESAAHFIGITGSSGKTSTKEFTATMLAQKYSVFKSEGNLNSITGMPLSLLSFEEQDCAVFEVGMNQPGEISSLSRLLKPQTGVLLNVNPVHIGQFDSLDAVADEKFSLTAGMDEDAVLIYNADDPRLKERASSFTGGKISFGLSENADLSLRNIHSMGVRGNRATLEWKGEELTFETPLCGKGNLYNIAAAAAVSFHLNLSREEVQRGIAELKPYSQRGVLLHINGIEIYDDSYNSNPKALEIALELIEESSGYKRKIIVIGDMLELGPREVEYHKAAGRQISSRAFDALITAGPLSRYAVETAEGIAQLYAMEDSKAAGEKAAEIIREGDLVLVKGSRGMKMEKVIDHLLHTAAVSSRREGLK